MYLKLIITAIAAYVIGFIADSFLAPLAANLNIFLPVLTMSMYIIYLIRHGGAKGGE